MSGRFYLNTGSARELFLLIPSVLAVPFVQKPLPGHPTQNLKATRLITPFRRKDHSLEDRVPLRQQGLVVWPTRKSLMENPTSDEELIHRDDRAHVLSKLDEATRTGTSTRGQSSGCMSFSLLEFE